MSFGDIEELGRTLPYPLGPRLLRLRAALERRDVGEESARLAYDVVAIAGIVLRFDAAIALLSYVGGGANATELNRLVVSKLRTPTDGDWLMVTQRLLPACPSSRLVEHLRGALSAKMLPGKELGPGDALRKLVSVRDRLVHGERVEADGLDAAIECLHRVVSAHRFLGEYDLRVCVGGETWSMGGTTPRKLSDPAGGLLTPGHPTLVRDGKPELSLAPLLHFAPGATEPIAFDELFFLNSGGVERLKYVAYRYPGHLDGRELGTYKAFRAFLARLPAPPVPDDPRLDFEEVVLHHERFVGRDDLLAEIARFVRDRPAPYGLVKGLAGTGKTALFARLHALHAVPDRPAPPPDEELERLNRRGGPRLRHQRGAHTPDASASAEDRWAFHFCSSAASRDNPVVALRSLSAQICNLFGFRLPQLPRTLGEVRPIFAELLERASSSLERGRLVLAIDALDEGLPPGGESIASALPALPANVVGLLSYRVSKDARNARVEAQLAHLPAEALRPIPGADPLAGLAREDVARLLTEVAGSAVPEATLDAAWRAATRDSERADPFFLRFVADGIEEGRVAIAHPDTIPESLDDAFEEIWTALPSDERFLCHRLLGLLAVMQRPADDALAATLLGDDLPPERVAQLRVSIGRLLAYEGERYGILHARLRTFLIGEQGAPAGARPPAFRPREVLAFHRLLANAAQAWVDRSQPESLRDYAFDYGIEHLVTIGDHAGARELLTNFEYCMDRLRWSGAEDAWPLAHDFALALGATPNPHEAATSQAYDREADHLVVLGSWAVFFRERAHLLARGDDEWPAHRILVQLATEHADESPVTRAAERWIATGACDWLWLARSTRRRTVRIDPCVLVLEGHKARVFRVALLPGGRLLSSSSDGTARIWTLGDGRAERTLSARDAVALRDGRVLVSLDSGTHAIWDVERDAMAASVDEVGEVCELSDGRLVFWRRGERTMRLWSESRVAPLEGHASGVLGAHAASKGRLLSWAEDGSLRLWTPADNEDPVLLRGHDGRVSSARELPDGRFLTVGQDHSARLWSHDGRACLAVLRDPGGSIDSAWPLATGKILSGGSRFLLWSSAGDDPLHVDDVERHGIGTVVHSGTRRALPLRGGGFMTWGTSGPPLHAWNPEGAYLGTYVGHAGPVLDALELPGGSIVSRSEDRTLKLWPAPGQAAQGREAIVFADGVLEGHADDVRGALVVPRDLLASYLREERRVRRLVYGEETRSESFLLTWSRDATIRLWSVDRARAEERALAEEGPRWRHKRGDARHRGPVQGVRQLRDGCVLTWSDDQTLRSWFVDGQALSVMHGTSKPITGAVELEDGRVVSWSHEHRLRTWDGRTGQELFGHEHAAPIWGAITLARGRVLSWSIDGEVHVWSARDGSPLRTLRLHPPETNHHREWGAVLSPMDRRIAFTSTPLGHDADGRRSTEVVPPNAVWGALELANGLILYWSRKDPPSLLCLEESVRVNLRGHANAVYGALELRDGRLLTWSRDRTLRTWSHSGEPLAVFNGHEDTVLGARELADGRILSWGDDGFLMVWPPGGGPPLEKFDQQDVARVRPRLHRTWRESLPEVTACNGGSAEHLDDPWRVVLDLSPSTQPKPPARIMWHATCAFRARLLRSDGTLVAAAKTGEVAFLTLRLGDARVTLTEARRAIGLVLPEDDALNDGPAPSPGKAEAKPGHSEGSDAPRLPRGDPIDEPDQGADTRVARIAHVLRPVLAEGDAFAVLRRGHQIHVVPRSRLPLFRPELHARLLVIENELRQKDGCAFPLVVFGGTWLACAALETGVLVKWIEHDGARAVLSVLDRWWVYVIATFVAHCTWAWRIRGFEARRRLDCTGPLEAATRASGMTLEELLVELESDKRLENVHALALHLCRARAFERGHS